MIKIILSSDKPVQIASLGAAKAELSIGKTTILSLLAGVYISLGGLAMLSVGGATPGLASVSHLSSICWCSQHCINFSPHTLRKLQSTFCLHKAQIMFTFSLCSALVSSQHELCKVHT